MLGIRVNPKASLAIRGERRNGFARLFVQGELDMSTAPLLESSLESVEREGDALIVDLAGLTFTDSSGVHAMARAAERGEQHGRRLEIVNCQMPVQRVFWLTGKQHLLRRSLVGKVIEDSVDGWSPIALPHEAP